MKSDWWAIENLAKQQAKALETNDFAKLEAYGDFGSYRRVLLGDEMDGSMLSFHNSLNPKLKVVYCQKLLKSNIETIESVLDVGCGMGHTANEIASLYPNAKVLAVDIASDAIKFGHSRFPNVDFICQGVDPEGSKLGEFNIIYAFEFYPFTRTSDSTVHTDYIRYLVSQLKLDGSLVIHLLWEQKESIFSTYTSLKVDFPDLKFEVRTVPAERIIKIFKIKPLCLFINAIACFLLRRAQNKVIIISKK